MSAYDCRYQRSCRKRVMTCCVTRIRWEAWLFTRERSSNPTWVPDRDLALGLREFLPSINIRKERRQTGPEMAIAGWALNPSGATSCSGSNGRKEARYEVARDG